MEIKNFNLTKKQGLFSLGFLLFSLLIFFSAFRLFASSVPTITSLSVNYGSTSGGTSVVITGTNFISTPTVTFGGTSASSVTFTSATSITATTAASISGIVDVTVTNPDTGTTTLARGFAYANTVINGNTTWSTNQSVNGIVITNNATLTVNNSITVTNSGPVFFANTSTGTITLGGTGTVFNGTDFEVQSGTASFDVPYSITTVPSFSSLTVESGATLTHKANTTTQAYDLVVNVSGNANILGTINLDGKGFAGGTSGGNGSGTGKGLGFSAAVTSKGAGGAGHGGTGGTGNYAASGGAGNDSLLNPVLIGSGGGSGYCTAYGYGGNGGSGGGTLKLNVGGTMNVSGAITVKGNVGTASTSYNMGGGGGGGGAVWIQTGTLSGNGSINTNGGNGGNTYAGGGAGGRIAISYTNNSSTITKTAFGGTGNQGGGAGTIFLKQGSNNGNLVIDNNNVSGASTPQEASVSYTFDNFTLGKGGKYVVPTSDTLTIATAFSPNDSTSLLTIDSGGTADLSALLILANGAMINNGTLNLNPTTTLSAVTLTNSGTINGLTDLTVGNATTLTLQGYTSSTPFNLNNLTIQSGGTVTHAANTTTQANMLNLNIANNFNLQSGGSISLDGKGFQGGATGANGSGGTGGGVGFAAHTTAKGSGGGAHGGTGGDGNNKAGGTSNDSLTSPVIVGSGGGGAYENYDYVDAKGGNGGGAVKLVVGGTANVAGTITAVGTAGSNTGAGSGNLGSGGGAGGAVWIQAGTLSGSGGSINTNGGNGGNTYAGGGAGGRIAISYTNDSSTITKTAFGGTGNQGGGAGTIFLKQGSNNGNLTIDNNNVSGASTPQEASVSYTFDNFTLGKGGKYVVPTSDTLTIATAFSPNDSTSLLTINSGGLADLSIFSTLTNGAITNNGTLSLNPTTALSAVTLTNSGTINGLTDLTVGNAATLTLQGYTSSTAFNLNNLTIQSGGIVNHSGNTTTQASMLNLNISNNLAINSGGSINLDGLGYAGGATTTPGTGSGPGSGGGYIFSSSSAASFGTGGAGHGGIGGAGNYGSVGAVNDSTTAPVNLGSGGGGINNTYYLNNYAIGGSGGGAAKLVVGGTCNIDGSISAKGSGGNKGGSTYSGGGAGGAVWIETGTLTGAGPITANGGNTTSPGGGGGGGIIYINRAINNYTGTVTANGGTGYQTGAGAGIVNGVSTYYIVTYTAGAHGSITGTKNQHVIPGQDGTQVTAVPATGYYFVNWSDSSTTNPRTDTNVQSNLSVTANFAPNTYTLAYTAGTNGTVSGTSPQTVNYGGSGTAVTANPSTGYHFVNWSDGVTQNPRTDTSVTTNKSVTANFAINTYTLTYNHAASGTITGTTPQTVNYGANGSTVTASPNAHYHFTKWSDDSIDNPRTDLNVMANITVMAYFAQDAYALTYAAGNGGTISGNTSQTVSYGANGDQVTAVPDSGYHFVNWSDSSTQNPRTDTNVQVNKSVTANFAADTNALTYNHGTGGTITGNASQTVNNGTDGSPVTATPNIGYHFVDWSDSSTNNPRTDTNVTSNLTVTANFAINTYTLTYTSGNHGTLSGNTDQTVNYNANGTTVTATPSSGFQFLNWSDGSTQNPRTDINVKANKTLTANFALEDQTIIDPTPEKITAIYNLGAFTLPENNTVTETSKATATANITLLSSNSSASVEIPFNTEITKTTAGNLNLTNLTTSNITQSIQATVGSSKAAVKIGIPNIPLTFSQDVTINLSVPSSYNNETLTIYTRQDNATDWTKETTCVVSNNICSFTTRHATEFTANFEVSNSPDPTHVNMDINSTITISCKDANTNTNDYIAMNPITGTGKSTPNANNDVNCNVITNNSNGYSLSFTSSTPELISTTDSNDKVNPYTPGTTNTPETWNVPTANSEWGARLVSNSTTYNPSTWGTIGTDDYTTKWYAVTNSNNFILSNRSTETNQTGDNQVIRFGAEVGSSKFQPTGTYTDNVTFTAVTN